MSEDPGFELMGTIERAMARNLQDYAAVLQQLIPDVRAAYLEVGGGVAAYTGLGSP